MRDMVQFKVSNEDLRSISAVSWAQLEIEIYAKDVVCPDSTMEQS